MFKKCQMVLLSLVFCLMAIIHADTSDPSDTNPPVPPEKCSGCGDPGVQHESGCSACEKLTCQVASVACPESCGKCEQCCPHVDDCICPGCTEPKKDGGYSFCDGCLGNTRPCSKCSSDYCDDHCRHCKCCGESISDFSGQCGSCKGTLCSHDKCPNHDCQACTNPTPCPLGCIDCEGNCNCSVCDGTGSSCGKCLVHEGSKDKCSHNMHTSCCGECNVGGECPCGVLSGDGTELTSCSNEADSGLCASCTGSQSTCSNSNCGLNFCTSHQGSPDGRCFWCYNGLEKY